MGFLVIVNSLDLFFPKERKRSMDKTWKKYYTVIWIEKVLENKIIGTEFFSLVIIDIKEF